jgi:hypothetical protein
LPSSSGYRIGESALENSGFQLGIKMNTARSILAATLVAFALPGFAAGEASPPPATSAAMQAPSAPILTRDGAIAIMRRVADWQLANPQHRYREWHNGSLLSGVLELHRVSGDEKYLKALLDIGEKIGWSLNKRKRHAGLGSGGWQQVRTGHRRFLGGLRQRRVPARRIRSPQSLPVPMSNVISRYP